MFVISLICKGRLDKSEIKSNPNDAIKVAYQWFKENRDYCGYDGYITIDSHEKSKSGNYRFAELRFDSPDDEVRLYLVGIQPDKPIFAHPAKILSKEFLLAFLESAVIMLAEFLKKRRE